MLFLFFPVLIRISFLYTGLNLRNTISLWIINNWKTGFVYEATHDFYSIVYDHAVRNHANSMWYNGEI